MLKKLTLLAMAVGALVAFAIPAAASANPLWYTTGIPDEALAETTEEGHKISLTGSLTSTAFSGAVVGGPCVVHATATLWNDPENGATGEVNSLTITTPCPAVTFGTKCEIESASSSFAEGPWHIFSYTENEGGNLGIAGSNFANVYKACTVLPNGVPIGAKGEATGNFNNATGCIEFNKSGDLEGAAGPVKLDGELCGAAGITLY